MAATREILATTTPQGIARSPSAQGFELLNLGPNSIWVALNDANDCVVSKCREVIPGEAWYVATHHTPYVRCTVNQVTGAATIFTEQ